jgi:hypothetical protein
MQLFGLRVIERMAVVASHCRLRSTPRESLAEATALLGDRLQSLTNGGIMRPVRLGSGWAADLAEEACNVGA